MHSRPITMFSFVIIALVSLTKANPIPFESGTTEEILAAIDQVVAQKPKQKATREKLNASLSRALASNDNPVKVRERSAWALGRLGGQNQIAVLNKAVKDKGLLVRSAALDSIVFLRDPSSLQTLIDVAKNDPNPHMRYWAILGIGLLRSDKAIKPLVHLSTDASEEVRGASTLAMAFLHSKKNDFSHVIDDMSADTSDFVQKRATFAKNVMQKSTEPLLLALDSDQTDHRLFGATYFKIYGKQTHLKKLSASMNGEPNDHVRLELEKAISAIKTRAAEAARKAKEQAELEQKKKAAATQQLKQPPTGGPSK